MAGFSSPTPSQCPSPSCFIADDMKLHHRHIISIVVWLLAVSGMMAYLGTMSKFNQTFQLTAAEFTASHMDYINQVFRHTTHTHNTHTHKQCLTLRWPWLLGKSTNLPKNKWQDDLAEILTINSLFLSAYPIQKWRFFDQQFLSYNKNSSISKVVYSNQIKLNQIKCVLLHNQ